MNEKRDKRINQEQKIENIIIHTICQHKLIQNGDKIVVAVSGGPDSMCLLHNLNEMRKACPKARPQSDQVQVGTMSVSTSPIRPGPNGDVLEFELVVAHVNHMLREEAAEEEEYVKKYCEKNGIEFYAKSIDVQKVAHTNKIGIEEAGRSVRYEFFYEVLRKTRANKVAIAHNKNDKIETILMHTLRGSGMEGLKGIEPKKGNIIRPLIECERSQIEEYCKDKQLNPKIDQSNFENIYHRNKIRNVVIPYLQKEFNPNIIRAIDRLAELITLEDEYMEKQTKKEYQEIVLQEDTKEIQIDLKKFNSQERVIKSRLIRYIIKRLLGSTESLEKIHIDDVIKLCNNNIGNKYLMPNKNIKILVKDRKIYFMAQV